MSTQNLCLPRMEKLRERVDSLGVSKSKLAVYSELSVMSLNRALEGRAISKVTAFRLLKGLNKFSETPVEFSHIFQEGSKT